MCPPEHEHPRNEAQSRGAGAPGGLWPPRGPWCSSPGRTSSHLETPAHCPPLHAPPVAWVVGLSEHVAAGSQRGRGSGVTAASATDGRGARRPRRPRPRPTLYPVLLHLLHLCDGLPQVVGELLAVLRVGGVEVDQHFDVGPRDGGREPDAVGVVCRGRESAGLCVGALPALGPACPRGSQDAPPWGGRGAARGDHQAAPRSRPGPLLLHVQAGLRSG